MKNNLPTFIRNQVLKRDNFSCRKCGFRDKSLCELEIHHIKPKTFLGTDLIENLVTLCSICHHYAPDSEKEFLDFINEKIDGKVLDTFRKSSFSISKRTKFGMERKAKEGGFITKAPRGYKLLNKQLIPDEEKQKEIEEIFKDFLNSEISLTKLGKKYQMTTAGIKKLLQNTTYLGKIKFGSKITKGIHEPLLNEELFNQVQCKLKQKGWIK